MNQKQEKTTIHAFSANPDDHLFTVMCWCEPHVIVGEKSIVIRHRSNEPIIFNENKDHD